MLRKFPRSFVVYAFKRRCNTSARVCSLVVPVGAIFPLDTQDEAPVIRSSQSAIRRWLVLIFCFIILTSFCIVWIFLLDNWYLCELIQMSLSCFLVVSVFFNFELLLFWPRIPHSNLHLILVSMCFQVHGPLLVFPCCTSWYSRLLWGLIWVLTVIFLFYPDCSCHSTNHSHIPCWFWNYHRNNLKLHT